MSPTSSEVTDPPEPSADSCQDTESAETAGATKPAGSTGGVLTRVSAGRPAGSAGAARLAAPAGRAGPSGPGGRGRADRPGTGRAAAYFDLDKTILATSTTLALGAPMHRSGLVSTLTLARGLLAQLPYLLLGRDLARSTALMNRLAPLMAGMSQQRLRQVVEEALATAIEPAVYAEALDLIAAHHQAGHDVVVVSASLAEIVEPIARTVGADRAVATRLETGADGRFTGRIEQRLLHEGKVDALTQDSTVFGVDLARSWAYSDSASDEPMLAAVGHPVAVNPDRGLRRTAEANGWLVRDFERPVTLRPAWHQRWPALLSEERTTVPVLTSSLGAASVVAVAATVSWLVARRPAS